MCNSFLFSMEKDLRMEEAEFKQNARFVTVPDCNDHDESPSDHNDAPSIDLSPPASTVSLDSFRSGNGGGGDD